ncbi:hypothetical protein CYD30_18875 [Kosakonia cowanii]|uniref:Uncharacterized protein n=1 Tax=Kosakonia cowanii JCM 10956 = DSM 18146 TaxID=1300165 RepID=A0A807LG96_9ENTR|nr:hypothetical protein BWI95_09400 [Kosakonia cowanii JCM 10956 = DSM 18146]AST71168.1 hypothetical protein BFG07_22460 [Kosakonia cowanii]TNL07095.1 hypothetical protein CYD30_18875 [Kosakonia cowanii]
MAFSLLTRIMARLRQVYVVTPVMRHYVMHITLNCFFDVTKSAFLCYYERYRTFLSFYESA